MVPSASIRLSFRSSFQQNPAMKRSRPESQLDLEDGNDATELKHLEKILGYQFKDLSILTLALRHRSMGPENNERLEFLGDALVGLIVGESLFLSEKDAQEGELTQRRARMVCADGLAHVARGFNLERFIRLGDGEGKIGEGKRAINLLADALEAVVAAVYLDSQSSLETVKRIFEPRLLETVSSSTPVVMLLNYKAMLLEHYQGIHGRNGVTFSEIERIGYAHAPQFVIQVSFDGEQLAKGVGNTKKAASFEAAKNAYEQLQKPLKKRTNNAS